ncbi:MAG: glycine cleavage system protein H [Gemmatimonadetes bacterium]|nr:glycine cleavage system protein H [Gemmatimonadota bacterium]
MGIWAGCEIPEELYYDVERDVWVRLHEDGDVTLGMTDAAQTRAGKLAHILIKKVGKHIERGRSAATVESAKWAGPLPSPLTGTVVANNAESFRADVLVANRDPYGEGWVVRLAPELWEDESAHLVTGAEAVERYRERIREMGIHCYRCEE